MPNDTQVPAKANITTGGKLAALVPQNLDEAYRISQALARSGNMVPDAFQGKPDAIMAAIMRGMEIGLAPMQSLASIAVINGRATIWGDAIPALMQRAGHEIDVKVEGAGDEMRAIATLRRADTGQTVVREFSWNDAKRAGLLSKKGPWTEYPRRMMMHRARAWAVRDGAADALMGLQIAEEAQDINAARDVTPKDPGDNPFARRIREAREAEEAKAMAPAADITVSETAIEHAKPEVEEAELIEDDPEVDPMSEAYDLGVTAFQSGESIAQCPFIDPTQMLNWLAGFKGAQKAAE